MGTLRACVAHRALGAGGTLGANRARLACGTLRPGRADNTGVFAWTVIATGLSDAAIAGIAVTLMPAILMTVISVAPVLFALILVTSLLFTLVLVTTVMTAYGVSRERILSVHMITSLWIW